MVDIQVISSISDHQHISNLPVVDSDVSDFSITQKTIKYFIQDLELIPREISKSKKKV